MRSVDQSLRFVAVDPRQDDEQVGGAGSGYGEQTVMARWLPLGAGWHTVGGAWDNSLMLLLPGESNDPRSPHYRDQYDAWIAGAMRPMLFTRAAVDAGAARRVTLAPATE